MSRLIRIALLTWAIFAAAVNARAASIFIPAPGSQSFDIFWSQMVGTTNMTALGSFSVNVTNTYADFYVNLTNNTSASAGERVHSIGFNSDPNGTSISVLQAGTYFKAFGLDQTFPSFKKIDLCAWTTNNCSGGAQGSNLPGAGGSDYFGFRLGGDFSSGLTLNNFVIKFQGDLGSFEFADTTLPRPVPEPSSLLLCGLGSAAALLAARRRATP